MMLNPRGPWSSVKCEVGTQPSVLILHPWALSCSGHRVHRCSGGDSHTGQGQPRAGPEGWRGSGKPASRQQMDSAAAAQRPGAPARTPCVLLFLFPAFSFQPHCPPFALEPSAAFSPHSAQFCHFLPSSQQFEPGPLTSSPSVSAESCSQRKRDQKSPPWEEPRSSRARSQHSSRPTQRTVPVSFLMSHPCPLPSVPRTIALG